MFNQALISTLLIISLAAFFPASVSGQLGEKKTLTLEAARKVASAAQAEANRNDWNVVIAIVDDGGHLVYLLRMDDVQSGSVEVAMDKARSAASFRRSTKVFEDAVQGGRTALLALKGAVPIEGGLPLSAGGRLIGAIGVSGVTSAQDGQIAAAGVAALEGM